MIFSNKSFKKYYISWFYLFNVQIRADCALQWIKQRFKFVLSDTEINTPVIHMSGFDDFHTNSKKAPQIRQFGNVLGIKT